MPFRVFHARGEDQVGEEPEDGTKRARPHLNRLIGDALLAMAVAALASQDAVSADEGSRSFEFLPGVLVDAERSVCYLMNTHDGIDAVDLRSGKALWTTIAAQKPLLLLGNTLLAQAEPEERSNVLTLILLDTQRSGSSTAQTSVELPDGVKASVDDGLGTAFRVEARLTSGGVTLVWTYWEQPISGTRPRVESPVGHIEGTVRLDAKTGQLARPSPEQVRDPVAPLPAKLAQLEKSGRLPSPLWRSGDTYAAAVRVSGDPTERAVLKRWRATSGDALPDVTLFEGHYVIRYPSADAAHLLATRFDRAATALERYEWLIFSLREGGRIAELRLNSPAAPFFVMGALLVHEVPAQLNIASTEAQRSLRAVDLQTAAERWVWPLRDTAYRGPFPPRNPDE